MPKTIIAEGKTTNEAIANGLKELKVSKDMVDIKVLENEEKRSFFSILAPRIVKVELTVKEGVAEEKTSYVSNNGKYNESVRKEVKKMDEKDIPVAIENINRFLTDFSKNLKLSYKVEHDLDFINVSIEGEDSSRLIGYRGETLNSLQTIINGIASKNLESKIRVILNIGDYKEKREKSLEDLAEKLAKTVLKTGKSITLEPMMAYERKIIHNKLQGNKAVRTYSIGNEPYRKVVIQKNK